MPFEADDQQRIDEAIAEAEADGSTKLLVRDATEHQKLGPLTVICTILNRTIGDYARSCGVLTADLTPIRLWNLRSPCNSAQKHWKRWYLAPSMGLRCRGRYFGPSCLA